MADAAEPKIDIAKAEVVAEQAAAVEAPAPAAEAAPAPKADAKVARKGRSAEFRASWHEEHGTAAKPRG